MARSQLIQEPELLIVTVKQQAMSADFGIRDRVAARGCRARNDLCTSGVAGMTSEEGWIRRPK